MGRRSFGPLPFPNHPILFHPAETTEFYRTTEIRGQSAPGIMGRSLFLPPFWYDERAHVQVIPVGFISSEKVRDPVNGWRANRSGGSDRGGKG